MKKLARGAAAGVAIAAVTLTGCSRPPSAAAVVDGVRIPDSLVRSTATVLTGVVGVDPADASLRATGDLALGETSKIIAADRGLEISDGEVEELLMTSQVLVAAASTEEGSDWAHAVSYTQVVLNTIGTEAYIQDLEQVDIEINPRYGVWDDANYTIASSSLAVDIPR